MILIAYDDISVLLGGAFQREPGVYFPAISQLVSCQDWMNQWTNSSPHEFKHQMLLNP